MNCRLTIPLREPKHNINNCISETQEIWKRKKSKCSLYLKAQNKKSDWYVKNGCSNHMTDDKKKFLTLKKEIYWSVSFGNNNSAKIIGRGILNLGRNNSMEKNVLVVEDMKQNMLSLSQMCDQGHTLQFDSEKCETR